jgi:DNA polymerase III epsilon subunit-like protein
MYSWLEPYVVFDIETTGLNPNDQSVIQLSWMTVGLDGPEKVRSYVMRAEYPVSDFIHNLTGISQQDVNNGSKPRTVYEAFIKDIEGKPVVGYNSLRFDLPFVRNALGFFFGQRGVEALTKERSVDVAALFLGYVRAKSWPIHDTHHLNWASNTIGTYSRRFKWKLAMASEEMGVDTSDLRFHDAGSDVLATHRLFEKLLMLGANNGHYLRRKDEGAGRWSLRHTTSGSLGPSPSGEVVGRHAGRRVSI